MSGIVPARVGRFPTWTRASLPYLSIATCAHDERRGQRKPRMPMGSEGGTVMKSVMSLLIAVWLVSGCVAGSAMTHEDSPGAVKRDEGPALCRDGTTPPCNDRG